MGYPVRMGIVFPRSGQRLYVTVSVLAVSQDQRGNSDEDTRSCRSKAAAKSATSKSE